MNEAIRSAILRRLPDFEGSWTFKVPENAPLLLTDNAAWKSFLGQILADTTDCIAPCRTAGTDQFDGYRSKQLWELQKKIIQGIKCPPFTGSQ